MLTPYKICAEVPDTGSTICGTGIRISGAAEWGIG